MREMLFRGQTIYKSKGNAWYKGSLITESEGAKIVYDTTDENGWEYVIPETVGQYTGLDDKNGNKIFEGDIVDILTENEEIGVVVYENGGYIVFSDGFCVDFINNIHGTDVEIIGNIYDNPELMNGVIK